MKDTPLTRGRVTRIKCPSCKGTGKWLIAKIPCQWCDGNKWLKADLALEYADWLRTIGDGGYLAGDHNWSDRQRFMAEADKIASYFPA